jgi:predicted permease
VAAIAFARWSLGAAIALIPARLSGGLFVVSAPELDWRVLLFAVGATTLVVLLSAVWPALSASRLALRPAVASSTCAVGMTRERRRASRALQAAQIAVALLLAIMGGLVTTSLVRLLTTDLGFDGRGLGVVSFSLPAGKYRSEDAQRVAIAGILERVRTTPGVRTAALGYGPGSSGTGAFLLPGSTGGRVNSAIRQVGDGYFDTAGIRIVAGRPIQAGDISSRASVAVIDEADARRVFGTESPLGRRFTYSPYVPEVTIVGVASHVALTDFAKSEGRVGVYLADSLAPNVLIRTDGDLSATLKNVRASLKAIEPGVRVLSSGAATDAYDRMETFAVPRFYAVLVSMFAGLALVTATVGLYGLLAYSVGRRQREIGVRVALGSTPGQVRVLILKDAIGPLAVGLAAGSIGAWWAGGLLASLLYGVGPRDPWAYGLGVLALLVASVFASIVPARRATGVDPIIALRTE